MPYELLEDVPVQKTPTQEDQSGGLLGSLGRIIGGAPIEAIGGIESLANLPAKLVEMVGGEKVPGVRRLPPIYENLQKIPAIKALRPQSGIEKVAQNILAQAPLTIATAGQSLPLAFARSAGSEIGSAIAEESGAGPLGQLGGSLLGGAFGGKAFDVVKRQLSKNSFKTGYEAIKKGIVDPTTLNNLATVAQEESYQAEKKLGENINKAIPTYEPSLDKIYNRIENNKALNVSDKNDLLEKIKLMKKDVQLGKINASQLIDTKKQLNDAFKQSLRREQSTYRNVLGELINLTLDTGEKIGQDHKEWYEAWKAGDNITKALNFKPELLKIIEENPLVSKLVERPLVKSLLGIGGIGVIGYGAGIPAALGGIAAASGAQRANQVAGFLQYPETRKLLADSFKYTIHRNIPQLIKTLRKLDTIVEESPQEKEASGRYELLD